MVVFTTLYGVLARLQQFTTLFLITAALVWAVYALGIGSPWLAAGGSLVILFGYALLLGIEFALMQAANRRDVYPAATPRQLVSAWCNEVRSAALVFCWRQPFRAAVHADRTDGRPGQRGLLLVHGFVCNRGLWNAWYPRLVNNEVPFIGVNLEPVFGGIDVYAGQIDAAVAALHESTGLAPVIVAHSMGGLAVRAWLRHAGAAAPARIHHVVTLGTPHRGTALARFSFSANSRQMLPAGAWLDGLLRSEATDLASRFTCMFSNCDNIVFPTSTATLPKANNVHIEACAHVQMADHPQAFDEVMHWLQTDAGASPNRRVAGAGIHAPTG